jgi:hypothetical protein
MFVDISYPIDDASSAMITTTTVLMALGELCGQATIAAIHHKLGMEPWGAVTVSPQLAELEKDGLVLTNGSVCSITPLGMDAFCGLKEAPSQEVELSLAAAPELDGSEGGELHGASQHQVPQSSLHLRPTKDVRCLVPQFDPYAVERALSSIR